MTRPTGSTPLYLATSEQGTTLAAEQDARLREIIGRLQACQADLSALPDAETVRLIAVAILQLRMRLSRISNGELKQLSDQVALVEPGLYGLKALGSG